MNNYIEVNYKVELIQIIIFLAKRQNKTHQALHNKYYCNEISQYFASFENHSAVIETQCLIDNKNFIHIKPLRAILLLENIVQTVDHELYEWAISVKKFEHDSKFQNFFDKQESYYNMIIDEINSYGLKEWITFTGKYFKKNFHAFYLFICPLAGNYGFVLDYPKKNSAYTVRNMPYYDDDGNIFWYMDFFAKGIAHEFAHCFVNPIVESDTEILKEMQPFFDMHVNMLDSYNTNYAIMNEYWVRAFAIRFMEKHHQIFLEFNIEEEYERQRKIFIYIDKFIEMLKEYENSNMAFENFYQENIVRVNSLI